LFDKLCCVLLKLKISCNVVRFDWNGRVNGCESADGSNSL
jgi:hypothetical protein